jgi:hypothetical protein
VLAVYEDWGGDGAGNGEWIDRIQPWGRATREELSWLGVHTGDGRCSDKCLFRLPALGTLYAYENAVKKASAMYNYDLHGKLLRKEISVALYHTAGKGTRCGHDSGLERIPVAWSCVFLAILRLRKE